MTCGALIKPDAFARASFIDAEMGWPRGLAIGRIAMLWAQAQADKGKSIVKRRLILEWAGIADAAEGQRFVDLCCKVSEDDTDDHIHFLELKSDDRYFIVGNPEQIQKIATFKARASVAGKKSGEVRAKKADANRPDRTPSSTPSELQVGPQADSTLAASSTQIEPFSLSSSLSLTSTSSVSPPVVPRNRGTKSAERNRKRWAKDTATAWATKAIGARRNGCEAEDAEKLVGRDGWTLLLLKYGTWEKFAHAYEVATAAHKGGGNNGTAFEAQLRESFRTLLLEAPATYEGETQ